MVDVEKLFARSARMIDEVAAKPLSLTGGMARWFDYCEKVAPEHQGLWKRLRQLDFEQDADGLTQWLSRLFKKEPPSDKINGLWFGLFNPTGLFGKPSCQMYVGGSSEFDPKSDSNEWVCQLSWTPKGRYSKSKVLKDLYRSVEPIADDEVSYLGEPFLCHGYLALVVSNWCHGAMRSTLLGNCAVRAVVMGHDSGDFYRMAVLRGDSRPTKSSS
jgi:hypothetical protein